MDSNYDPYRNLLRAMFENDENLLPLRPSDIRLIDQALGMAPISERELLAVRLRFGIGGEKHTYTEIGQIIRDVKFPDKFVTRERAKQVCETAQRKIRGSKSGRMLLWLFRDHLENKLRSLGDLPERVKLLERMMAKMNPHPLTKEFLGTSIDDLDLSVRTYNCLKNAEILTIQELLKKTEQDLRGLRNFGEKSVKEIKAKLAEYGLALGGISLADYASDS